MSLRINQLLRSLPPRSTLLARPAPRLLHTSPRCLASEVPKDPLADPAFQTFYEKVRNHQGAVDAMMRVGKVMQEKGVDTSQPPSKIQMMKLAFDKDLREAATNLMTQLKDAGVELDQETMMKLFNRMK